ncbi:hypothetical protein Aduo_018352 [Ancylostoma duodenale]
MDGVIEPCARPHCLIIRHFTFLVPTSAVTALICSRRTKPASYSAVRPFLLRYFTNSRPTDTNTETLSPPCCDTGLSSPDVHVLAKMEQLNRANEEDTRSLASRKSGSSGSPKGHEPSLAEDDEEDLWSVWGEVIRNWEVEVKKNPNSIKTLVKRGIPQHFRTIAWQLLSNASVSSIHEVYSDYMRQSSVYEKV